MIKAEICGNDKLKENIKMLSLNRFTLEQEIFRNCRKYLQSIHVYPKKCMVQSKKS